MTTNEVAQALVDLCRIGDYAGCVEQYYSPDIISIEPQGDPAEVRGLKAVHAKMEWWSSTTEVHGSEVLGPFVNGDQFAVEFKIDSTDKKTGERSIMDEIGVYTVKGGKIAEERFFYASK